MNSVNIKQLAEYLGLSLSTVPRAWSCPQNDGRQVQLPFQPPTNTQLQPA